MDAQRTRILVVDDNAQNRELAKATLEDDGLDVLLASSGAEALALLEAENVDCVLLDVRMPGMNGFETCAQIRAMPSGTHTPVIFLTALRDVDTFDDALRSGGDDFLTKPVSPTELLVRVQAALRLRRMGAELRESYELLRRQRDDLMRVQLQKERLTAFVVHDLKSPVHSLDLHAQLLLRDASLSHRSRSSVQHIREEARSLLRIILNLLDISKSEEGKLSAQMVSTDLAAMGDELLESLSARAEASEVTLELDLEVKTMKLDPDLMRRVLENLIDNALRHAPPSTAIVLSSRRLEDGAIELRVSDRGEGIAPAMRAKIFERFVQLQAGEALVARTSRGLGLTFCKVAVEAHGATMRIEDAAPGAAFCMRFPHD